MNPRQLSRGQQALAVIVVAGTVAISLIGFVGSYDAVLRLAQRNGFGWFSYLLPVGIDVGITVFLALDLLLTWMRIPLPILRQLAWVLTGATIVFNAASAWPNPLSSGMHGVVPLLFVAAIEAARHTVGRLAQIEANQLFERTRLGRWIFAPVATMRLFRRRVLWELRSYEEALEHERRRLVYRARLRSVYGRLWRFKAPVDFILLLKLANLGEPLPEFKLDAVPVLPGLALPAAAETTPVALPGPAADATTTAQPLQPTAVTPDGAAAPAEPTVAGAIGPAEPAEDATPDEATQAVPGEGAEGEDADATRAQQPAPQEGAVDPGEHAVIAPAPAVVPASPMRVTAPATVERARPALPAQGTALDRYRAAFMDYTHHHGDHPDADQLAKWLFEQYGVTGRTGEALSSGHLRRHLPGLKEDWQAAQAAAPVE
ncbi:DUF2637 domain-containing protein [Streptacidiphilus pinicola]|nr:DUF2637 domain-containing protein [Streptacidiphilus pinicola]